MVFSPFYENYGADAILSGAEPIYIPLVPPDFHFDLSLIEDGFRLGAKCIIICNPSNPCGKVFTKEELTQIGELAIRYDAYVVTDEVYEYMVYKPNEHTVMASLPGMAERTITCNSLSKTFSITGWRLGYLIGPEPVLEAAKILPSGVTNAAPNGPPMPLDDVFSASLIAISIIAFFSILSFLPEMQYSPAVPDSQDQYFLNYFITPIRKMNSFASLYGIP